MKTSESRAKKISSILEKAKNLGLRNTEGLAYFLKFVNLEQLKPELVLDNKYINKFPNDYKGIPVAHFSTILAQYILDFLLDLLSRYHYETLLDPHANICDLIKIASSERKIKKIVAIDNDFENLEHLIELVIDKKVTDYYQDDFDKVLDQIDSKFDLIISRPPFGYKYPYSSNELKINHESYKVADYASRIILKSCSKLSEDGIGLFFVEQSFFFKYDKSIWKYFESTGLCVDAIFEIPNGAFLPYTSIGSNLIVVKQGKQKGFYIGSVSNNHQQNENLIHNYFERRNGKYVQLGRIIDNNNFISVSNEIIKEEIHLITDKQDKMPLRDICLEINNLNEKNLQTHLKKTNCVYIPKFLHSKAVSIFEKSTLSPHNLFQLVLNERIANADFIAEFFNTEVGKLTRNQYYRGSAIPTIPKSALYEISIPLPTLQEQLELLSLNSKFNDYAQRIQALKKQLWDTSADLKKIENNLQKTLMSLKEDQWLEYLPFPIASIIYGYYSTSNVQRKFDYIISSFEGLSEFLAVIKLSGINTNQELAENLLNNIAEDDKHKNWYKRTDFGGWNYVSSKLSKEIRKLNNNEDDRNLLKNIFGNPNQEFIELVSTKLINSVMDEVATLRNKWKGHGGVANDKEYNNRNKILENYLNNIKEVLIEGFSDVRLIQPISMELEGGVFYNTVRDLTGTRTKFREIPIETAQALDKTYLYLIHPHELIPIPLLPLIKMRPSPATEQNACYFYNRINDGGSTRWVSYHFEQESEVIDEDPTLNVALELLSRI